MPADHQVLCSCWILLDPVPSVMGHANSFLSAQLFSCSTCRQDLSGGIQPKVRGLGFAELQLKNVDGHCAITNPSFIPLSQLSTPNYPSKLRTSLYSDDNLVWIRWGEHAWHWRLCIGLGFATWALQYFVVDTVDNQFSQLCRSLMTFCSKVV